MKIKNTSPTPKSMTHKKPINISASSNNSHQPKRTKYIPAKYHKVRILYVLIKKVRVTNDKICKINISLNIKYTQS